LPAKSSQFDQAWIPDDSEAEKSRKARYARQSDRCASQTGASNQAQVQSDIGATSQKCNQIEVKSGAT